MQVKAHTDPIPHSLLINFINVQAEKAEKAVTLGYGEIVTLSGDKEPMVFGSWLLWQAKQAEDGRITPEEWQRVNPQLLKQKLYQIGIWTFVKQESGKRLKDARDLAKWHVMSTPVWLANIRITLDDKYLT